MANPFRSVFAWQAGTPGAKESKTVRIERPARCRATTPTWTRSATNVAALLERLKGPFDWPPEKGQVLGIGFALPRLEGREPDPGTPHPDGVHGTADFIATSDGILFLEGGPPHFMGAHPCCFPAGATTGVALENAQERQAPTRPERGGTPEPNTNR